MRRGTCLVLAVLLVVVAGWLIGQTRGDVGVQFGLAAVFAFAVASLVLVIRGRGATGMVVLIVVALVADLASGFWIGANSPQAGWFGHIVSHGSRRRGMVAITFDDGPNDSATLAIDRLLVDRRAVGTFFLVGKAVEARPDLVRTLVADGQVVGSHSFHHDSTRWLDPRYPELMRAERSISRTAAVCPAFFRPPHGQHTPFMTGVADRRGITVATWDVSVGDWKASSPDAIARSVLRRVRPGSIIDLHDGLDGDVSTDRTVLVRAMPAILDGLAQRGLDPVGLDRLLGRPAYLARC